MPKRKHSRTPRSAKRQCRGKRKDPPGNPMFMAPVRVGEHVRTTMLCLNRVLGVPDISQQIASIHKASFRGDSLRRLEYLRKLFYRGQDSLNFNANCKDLSTVIDHVKETVDFLKYYRNDCDICLRAMWFLRQLCRFTSIRRIIAKEALTCVLQATKRHSPRLYHSLDLLLNRLLQIDGLKQTGDSRFEIPIDRLLVSWKNQVVDKLLDAGLRRTLISERHSLQKVLVWKFMHLNLLLRPSSRYSDQGALFANVISMNNWRFDFSTVSFVDFQDRWQDWNRWMAE